MQNTKITISGSRFRQCWGNWGDGETRDDEIVSESYKREVNEELEEGSKAVISGGNRSV